MVPVCLLPHSQELTTCACAEQIFILPMSARYLTDTILSSLPRIVSMHTHHTQGVSYFSHLYVKTWGLG
jgi:hypothetical protein